MGKESSHRQILQKLRRAFDLEMNVLMEGPAGTGKTSLVIQIAKEMGLRMKYYSASTLDPFVDLVGLPVPLMREDGRRSLEFHRQDDVMMAQLVFFDELNRAHTKVLNAVLEMIQFHTINGERLPHLKAVFAACNPANGDYLVTDLDPALVDRFHLHLNFGNAPDRSWFQEHYQDTGAALCDWWALDLSSEQRAQVSPRKLEHMAQLICGECDPEDSIPGKIATLPFHQLRQRLQAQPSFIDIKDFVRDPDAYAPLVASDAEVALRFAQLLPAMKAVQLYAVRMIVLALPNEFLAQVEAHPAILKRLFKAIGSREGAAEANAFRELIAEQLKLPATR